MSRIFAPSFGEFRLKRVERLARLPPARSDHRHRAGKAQRLDHARHRSRPGARSTSTSRAAMHRRRPDRRMQHARQREVDAVGKRPVRLGGNVEPLRRGADDAPLAGLLQRQRRAARAAAPPPPRARRSVPSARSQGRKRRRRERQAAMRGRSIGSAAAATSMARAAAPTWRMPNRPVMRTAVEPPVICRLMKREISSKAMSTAPSTSRELPVRR